MVRNARIGATVLFALALVSGVTTVSCSKKSVERQDDGSVGLALTLPGGASVSTVDYTITGNGITPITGSIDVSAPGVTQATALVSGLLAGSYTVAMNAASSDGQRCAGSAPFTVVAGQTATVNVLLQCARDHTRGAVAINGRLDQCPSISSISATSLQATLGTSITVSVAATDPDPGTVISYAWTQSPSIGTIGGPGAATTTFTCNAPGSTQLSIAVSDGICGDSLRNAIPITCLGQCAQIPDGTPCNDGNACTIGDTCQSGACMGGDPITCVAPDQCHYGDCDPQTGACSILPMRNGQACSDGDLCTRDDFCLDGTCMMGTPLSCDIPNACHAAGTCDPLTGRCPNPAPDGTACDDGMACTTVDTCQSGVCTGRPTVRAVFAFPSIPSDFGVISASYDGTVVIGRIPDAVPARWTAATGVQVLSNLTGLSQGISADGSVVVGYALFPGTLYHAFRWSVSGGVEDLGSFSNGVNNGSFATNVDPSGSIVVGYSYTPGGQANAFLWTAGGGLQNLGTLYPFGNSVPQGISADGRVVVGSSAGIVNNNQVEERAFRWTAGTGMRSLGSLGTGPSYATAANEDGAVVVGQSQAPDGTNHAFRWTALGGMQDLGAGPDSLAQLVTAKGDLVLGQKADGPFAWTASTGAQNINTFLTSQGLDLGGVTFVGVQAISPDATTMTGLCRSPTDGVVKTCVLTGQPLCGN